LSEYVVLKICTGEQLLATLLNETLDGVTILDPIQVKLIPMYDEGEYVEQAITNNYCQFSQDRSFTFHWKDVIYCKELDPVMIKYYKKLVLAFGEESRARTAYYREETKGKDSNDLDKLLDKVSKSIKFH
jgi:hypothetical protein